MIEVDYQPSRVRVLLKQHIGAPAQPVVSWGEPVQRGQVVAQPPPDKLGANLHASIDGTVTAIDETSIWISRVRP
jgi:Na+-translocating ferredoxin:NAD+ oxidoreductase RnfC subunit